MSSIYMYVVGLPLGGGGYKTILEESWLGEKAL